MLDIRFPTLPVAELQRHHASVNSLAWAPHSSCHICSAGDDSQALIWDLSTVSQPLDSGLDPILAYTVRPRSQPAPTQPLARCLRPRRAVCARCRVQAGAEINQLQWSSSQPDWIAVCFANKLQILRV